MADNFRRTNRKTKECKCNRKRWLTEKRLHRFSTKIKENNDKIGSTPSELIAKYEIQLLNRQPHIEKWSENFHGTWFEQFYNNDSNIGFNILTEHTAIDFSISGHHSWRYENVIEQPISELRRRPRRRQSNIKLIYYRRNPVLEINANFCYGNTLIWAEESIWAYTLCTISKLFPNVPIELLYRSRCTIFHAFCL